MATAQVEDISEQLLTECTNFDEFFRITFVADFQGGILIFVLNHGKVESDKKHIEGQNSRKAVTQS